MTKRQRWLIGMGFAYVLAHLAIWLMAGQGSVTGFLQTFYHGDTQHYAAIAHGNGYTMIDGVPNQRYAFFPLLPMLLKGLASLLAFFGVTMAPGPTAFAYVGAGLSLLLLVFFVVLVERSPFVGNPMKPETLGGWFFLIFAPASYVFHTAHTEALFLVLSWGAFAAAIYSRRNTAALLGGLCALTKNQGVLTSIFIGFINAQVAAREGHSKLKTFVKSGLGSGLVFAPWLLFQYATTQRFLAFVEAQKDWKHVETLGEYFVTLIGCLRYTVQLVKGHRSFRAILFYAGIVLAIGMIRSAKKFRCPNGADIPLLAYMGWYILACSLLLPAQGYLENTFRFHLILFPLWFGLGDWCTRRLQAIEKKWQRNLCLGLALGVFVAINLQLTYLSGIDRWAY